MDSWEMSSQNWTARFREEFQRRRGYDLLAWLPVMTGRVVGSLEVSERFLWDLRQTAQELVLEHHASHLRELGRRDGFGLSIEPYDLNPCADLSLGGEATVPMCEFWAKGHGFHTEFSAFEAVSIAHTLGRPIVAAESFTSGDTERWQLYPGALKGQGDWALCAGVNRFVFHRYQHQPWLDRAPGMTMGPYGVHWERTQTWWDLAGGYHEYLSRCQFLLRRGLPVADICYLAPEGAPQVFRPPKSATRGDPPDRLGYNFDGCAPEALMNGASVSDGRLVFPGGMSYRVLVLPRFDTMTPALLRKIKGLVEAGATVVGAPPRKSPGLSNYPQCDLEVESLAAGLWGKPAVSDKPVGKGRVVRDAEAAQPAPFADIYPGYGSVARLLAAMNVAPDFDAAPFLRYTHRRDGDTDIYFVANPEARRLEASATFRVDGRQPELWDPVTGEQRPLPEFAQHAGCTSVPLRLEPHQSYFIVFRKAGGTKPAPGRNFADSRPAQDIDGPWEVAFQRNRGAPESVRFNTLTDWTKASDPGVRYFSGIATYRTQFDWKPRQSKVLLDLGQVEVMAGVRLNGHDLGPVWTAPYRVDVTAAVKPGPNLLEIRVANLWPNRLIGDAGLPPAQRVAWTTWNPFAKDSPLLPSGLLGPVRLAAEGERDKE
ncbi:MAG: glycosyl hydrolase [Limisphaerales bacterium]